MRRPRSSSAPANPIDVLVAEHAAFRRFLALRVGSETDADDILQEGLPRVLTRGVTLRRGERMVAWFYRVVRDAIVDHFRRTKAGRRQAERMLDELRPPGDGASLGTVDWETAVFACITGLLPSLKPRYGELIRRVDLVGEIKIAVARDLKLSRGQFDVALHRARRALRRRLELFCGACSRESCLACFCRQSDRSRKTVDNVRFCG